MNEDYLWDRSGTPDPDVARLESLLARYAAKDRTAGVPPAALPASRRPVRVLLAIAAALVLLIALTAFAMRFRWRTGEAWPIASVTGTPTINGRAITPETRFGIGDELRTDGSSRATVQIARVGELEIAPNSTVTLMQTRGGRHRVRLDRGHVSARVWAPPFTFSVHTPAGLASDVGCAFDLRYDGGSGEVRVTSGWVDFDGEERSSLIPAGAVAELRGENPGSPYYADASHAFRAALRAYDHDTGPIAAVTAAARPRDAMTLLHLLERAPRADRGPLFDALVRLAPPPTGVTREGVVDRDLEMLDDWRHALGLGGIKRWWLHWRDAL
ncbi:MAG TPA: FecR family protein [Thermoanaerobaculia bacterium]|nr:FecR family protein [Thermoanaerobaculia bacterium]